MPEIEIYTSSTCGYCKQAKKLLDGKNVAYDEKVVDANPKLLPRRLNAPAADGPCPRFLSMASMWAAMTSLLNWTRPVSLIRC